MKYIGSVIGLKMNPGTPTGQQLACGGLAGFPASTSSLRLRTTSLAQGIRIEELRSANWSVGCRPVTRNSSFVTYGCVGSCCTGPGPLGGEINWRLYAYQPMLASGAKLGGMPCAIAEKLKRPTMQTTLARIPTVTLPACRNMGPSY